MSVNGQLSDEARDRLLDLLGALGTYFNAQRDFNTVSTYETRDAYGTAAEQAFYSVEATLVGFLKSLVKL